MRFTPNSTPTMPGPAEWFTGGEAIDGIRNPGAQSAVGCGHVRFSPGAWTVWHTHPKSRTLYVTDGVGLVGTRDGGQELRPGDVVFAEPGEPHRHGAAPGRFMSHIAIQETDESGQTVVWGEPVTDEQYRRP